MSYLTPKDKPEQEKRVFPLVSDFNPALPNIGAILNKHKHILYLDSELTKVIDPSNIFASYRGTKTLKDLLIHSRLPLLEEENVVETPIKGGCQPCKKRCVLCKNYLIKSDYAYSHQTETKFRIKSVIDCNTRNIIYIINDNICKISSVGYTADTMKTRFTNHKSHIKFNKRLCEVSKHMADNLILHELDKTSQSNYDKSLCKQIEVLIIEEVDLTGVGNDIESIRKKLKEREWFWQNNLKTLRQYGGLNVREERS